MALTQAQLAARDGKITASFAPQLMAGDAEAIHQKFLELIGDPDWQPFDFSNNWPVQHGVIVEPLALDWHQKKTGHPLTRRGEVVTHPKLPHVCATLDGYRAQDRTVLDVKCSGGFRKLDELLPYYQPQLIVQRECAQADHAALLLVHGGAEPVEYSYDIDPDFEQKVWDRIAQFWECVNTLTAPSTFTTVTPVDKFRVVNLDNPSGENWCSAISDALDKWGDTEIPAKQNEAAKKLIKEILPPDVKLASKNSGSLTISRARNNAITVKRGRAS